MGNFMIPCCCVCGKSPEKWHDSQWETDGGLQDFCPFHVKNIKKDKLIEYLAPHLRTSI